MQDDCLSRSAALQLALSREWMSYSSSNSLCEVQPLMMVAAMPVEVHAENVRECDLSLAIMQLYKKLLPAPPGPSRKNGFPSWFSMDRMMAFYAARYSGLSLSAMRPVVEVKSPKSGGSARSLSSGG